MLENQQPTQSATQVSPRPDFFDRDLAGRFDLLAVCRLVLRLAQGGGSGRIAQQTFMNNRGWSGNELVSG